MNEVARPLSIHMAGLQFRLQPTAVSPALALSPAYAAFATGAAADVAAGAYQVVAVAEAELEPIAPGRLAWQCHTWRLGSTAPGLVGIEIHSVPTDTWHVVANLSLDYASGTIHSLVGRKAALSAFALNYPYDQVVLMNRMIHYDAGIVHASGVILDGAGYIFTGPADAGKTTLARLWRNAGATLLNDDRVVVRIVDGEARVAASPWHGDEPEINVCSAPLRGIFHIGHAAENRLTDLGSAMAAARLMGTTIAPFYDADGIARVLALWDRLVGDVPSFQLGFTPDIRALDLCRTRMM